MIDVVRIAASALHGAGLDVFGTCSAAAWDARAPEGLRARDLMPRARGALVVGSAGRALWAGFREEQSAHPERWEHPDPLDAHVARALDRADAALALARVGTRRFEAAVGALPVLDFRALGELAGLGSLGPFGLLIHPVHGPWWALRAAWLVDVDLPDSPLAPAPCVGCPAPCIGSAARHGDVIRATPEVRSRCVVGGDSRYDAEQIAYHYEREPTLARLRAGTVPSRVAPSGA